MAYYSQTSAQYCFSITLSRAHIKRSLNVAACINLATTNSENFTSQSKCHPQETASQDQNAASLKTYDCSIWLKTTLFFGKW